MKIIAIVQSRMGSTRLPGKMMMSLADKAVIQCVFDRIKLSKLINEFWLATTLNFEDDVLEKWASANKTSCFRGSSDDVLDRYYQTAKKAGASRDDIIVRITGDCPLHDYKIIDKIISEHINSSCDYTCNNHPPTYPDGLDTEVFSYKVLEQAWNEAELKSEREHVTPYIWKNPKLFKIKNISHNIDLSKFRWTLDTAEDLKFLELLTQQCKIKGKFCGMHEIVEILSQHPEWLLINIQHKRDEGYLKSILEDTIK